MLVTALSAKWCWSFRFYYRTILWRDRQCFSPLKLIFEVNWTPHFILLIPTLRQPQYSALLWFCSLCITCYLLVISTRLLQHTWAGQLSGIALGYGLDGRGFESQQSLGIFLFAVSIPVLRPTQPRTQWVSGTIFLGVKRPGREADHSPPSSAEVKNTWSYTSVPQYAFMAWCSVKAQGFYLLSLWILKL
jgi:hypothetical protein